MADDDRGPAGTAPGVEPALKDQLRSRPGFGAADDLAGRYEPGSARAKGIRKMEEVYGFTVDPAGMDNPYLEATVDHVFGEVWTRPALDVRDRRLITLGVLAALGQASLVEVQYQAALDRGELTEEQVAETVVHLAHYVGWPLATGVNDAAQQVLARHRQAVVDDSGARGATAS